MSEGDGSWAEPTGPGDAHAGEPGPVEAAETGTGGPPPREVRTACILMYVVAGLALLQGLLSLVASVRDRNHLASGLLALAFAIAYAVLAGRARQGDRTARTIAVVLSALSVAGDIVQLPANPIAGTIGILLNGGIIGLLAVHPRSRLYFGGQRRSGQT